jgi:hypothetical protein
VRADRILTAALGPDHRWVGRNLDYLGLVLRMPATWPAPARSWSTP